MRRFFIAQSFELYGGAAGLVDFGTSGCAFKRNVIQEWTKFFVENERMDEVDCMVLTPRAVFAASGHEARFNDIMTRDLVTGAPYRTDTLVEQVLKTRLADTVTVASDEDAAKMKAVLERIEEVDATEMTEVLKMFDIKSPEGNALSEASDFNLMFKTHLGPLGDNVAYLRPETAQGIFVNFRRLADINGNLLPFAAACVGKVFRNEISPRTGLVRTREFEVAEIEHFLNPADTTHPKMSKSNCTMWNLEANLWSREGQVGGNVAAKSTLGEALEKGILKNETLAYFLGRTHMFIERCGAKMEHVRFRQHLSNEMAHYAADCWDLEIETSRGWIECAGLADRHCFDLSAHAEASKSRLDVFVPYDEPKIFAGVRIAVTGKGPLGKVYKKAGKALFSALAALSDTADDLARRLLKLHEEVGAGGLLSVTVDSSEGAVSAIEVTDAGVTLEDAAAQGEVDGKRVYVLSTDHLTVKTVQVKISGEFVTPGVVEPSFGVGRIVYALLEHAFYERRDAHADTAGSAEEEPVEDKAKGKKKKKGGKKDKVAPVTEIARCVLRLAPALAPTKVVVMPLIKDVLQRHVSLVICDELSKVGLRARLDDACGSIGRRYARSDEIGVPFAVTVDGDAIEDLSEDQRVKGVQLVYEDLSSVNVTLRERDTCRQVRLSVADVVREVGAMVYGRRSWAEIEESHETHAAAAVAAIGEV